MFSCWWSIINHLSSFTADEDISLKDFGVSTLTFCCHVTSSVTWPLDSVYAISYWWSIVAMRLSCIVRKPPICV